MYIQVSNSPSTYLYYIASIANCKQVAQTIAWDTKLSSKAKLHAHTPTRLPTFIGLFGALFVLKY